MEAAEVDAVDRLFDDSVILAMIGLALTIAWCVMRAFGKLFRGMQ